MIFITPLITFLVKYWKYLVGAILIIGIVGAFTYVYYKGKDRQKDQQKIETLKEIIKRDQEVDKVDEHGKKVIREFHEFNEQTPDFPKEKEDYYECLLADDPLNC